MSFGNAVKNPHYVEEAYLERAKSNHVTYAPGAYRNEPIEEDPVPSDAPVTVMPHVRIEGKALAPHYCDPGYGRDARAEAVAKAVRNAVRRGEIDPELFV